MSRFVGRPAPQMMQRNEARYVGPAILGWSVARHRRVVLVNLDRLSNGPRHARAVRITGTFAGTTPEFLVILCPLVYPGVTMCPASIGGAVKRCYDRLRGLFGRIDSPHVQSTIALSVCSAIGYGDSLWGIHSSSILALKFFCTNYLCLVQLGSPVNPR